MDEKVTEQQKDTPPLNFDEVYCVVAAMVEELNWRYSDEHKALVIRALRLVGVSDVDIRGYFAGNIIL